MWLTRFIPISSVSWILYRIKSSHISSNSTSVFTILYPGIKYSCVHCDKSCNNSHDEDKSMPWKCPNIIFLFLIKYLIPCFLIIYSWFINRILYYFHIYFIWMYNKADRYGMLVAGWNRPTSLQCMYCWYWRKNYTLIILLFPFTILIWKCHWR